MQLQTAAETFVVSADSNDRTLLGLRGSMLTVGALVLNISFRPSGEL